MDFAKAYEGLGTWPMEEIERHFERELLLFRWASIDPETAFTHLESLCGEDSRRMGESQRFRFMVRG